MPSLLLFFFSSTKTKTKKKICRQSSLIEKLWMTSTNQLVWQHPPACRPVFYLDLFFSSFFFLFVCHIHARTLIKFVADRFSPSPTMQLTSRKQHLLLQYVHTQFFFFRPTISKRSKAKMIHTQREKKVKNKK